MRRARLRVCSEPGCPTLTPTPRCPDHQSQLERHQRATTPTKVNRDWSEIVRRRAAVEAHRAVHGDWCPGFECAPHPSSDLTADHVVDQQAGGAADGELQVLCRACNSRKARRVQLALASPPTDLDPVKSGVWAGRSGSPGGHPRGRPHPRRRRGGLRMVRRVQDDPGSKEGRS